MIHYLTLVVLLLFPYFNPIPDKSPECQQKSKECQVVQAEKDTVDRQEAIEILINKLIVPATLDHDVTAFLTKEPLQPGDIVEPFLDGSKKVIKSPTWFAWINDDPQAFFAHSTRYVFINQISGNIEVKKEDWWPVLNETDLFMSDEELVDLDIIIYSDMHQK